MNNFDEKYSGAPEGSEESIINKESMSRTAESSSEKENAQQGVVFNEDGTYHGVVNNSAEEKKAQGNERTEENKANGGYYSYANGNDTGAGTNNYRNSSYPYGNNSGQNQGNYQGGYPYQNGSNNGYGNGYNYGGQGGYNPYPGNRPPYDNSDRKQYAYNNEPDNKKGKGVKIFAIVAGVLCGILAIALVIVLLSSTADTDNSTSVESTTAVGTSQNTEEFVTQSSPESPDTSTADGELLPKGVYNKVLPSSVGILVYGKGSGLASEGSGVLFQESSDGKYTYIITCAHVISDSSASVIVQTYDGKEYDASIVGYDSRTDIGVLRIEANGLTLAEIGDSTKIHVGDPIYAIGNPGGVEFANSFTNGIVSAIDRPVSSSASGYTTDCIQHTAAINPGNSGGALVNSFGQVIGINSMKIVADEYEGMGFAVPSSVFQNVVNELMTNGYVSNRPKLGITYVPASEYSSYGMFVAIKGLPSGSIVVYEIASDSSLAGTKVEKGDMITGVNGKELGSPSELSELIENSAVGDEITLSVVRVYEDYTYDEFEVTVTLVEDRGNTVVEEEETTEKGRLPGDSGSYEDFFKDYFGE